jgi:cytochrome c
MSARGTSSDGVDMARQLSGRGRASLRKLGAVILGAALLAVACAQTGGPQAAPVAAADVPALMRAKGCHACHAADEALLGPSYAAIATMHGARRDVMVDVLAEKIVAGGAGNWGVAPMPRNDRVTSAEARAMAAWILDEGEG